MSLQFGAATSDTVDIPNSAFIQNLDPFSWIIVATATTFTNLRAIVGKGTAAAVNRKQIRLNGTAGNIDFIVERATTAAFFQANNATMAPLGAWHAIAATFSSAVSPTMHIYATLYGGPLIECTYQSGATIDGVGAVGNDSASILTLGNSAGHGGALQGHIAYAALYPVAMSLEELRNELRVQRRPAAGKWYPGSNGKGAVIDMSGNGGHGTITGAIPVSNFFPRNLSKRKFFQF